MTLFHVATHRPPIVLAAAVFWALVLWPGATVQGAPERYGIGTTPSAEEIDALDIDIMPDGRGLPPGSGSAGQGRELYLSQCGGCHGNDGTGGSGGILAGTLAGAPVYQPRQFAEDPSLRRTVGNYWSHATSLFDYIRRAMPFDRPGSLDNDQLYSVTAYVLFLNGLVAEDSVLDAHTLPQISMPAEPYFRPADTHHTQTNEGGRNHEE